MIKINKMTVHLTTACVMCLAGLVLVFSGFWVAPEGEIHNSVLIAFGEVITFAGALFGVDYSYRVRTHNPRNKEGGEI
ncbi:MAG: hypothetical protein IKJ79_04710 [Bacteroidaceae bacterium]|nr:hypothetical protein [Bacteroidaceae bacterium]MBR4069699.1 hypothetical protein [Bacteroidaceae bacterium]